jgi:large conductance mechanosensitive channel protein
MGMLSEFKEFAMRGNVVDLAVGVVIGAASSLRCSLVMILTNRKIAKATITKSKMVCRKWP